MGNSQLWGKRVAGFDKPRAAFSPRRRPVTRRMGQVWLRSAFLVCVLLVIGAGALPATAADVGPKPTVEIMVNLDGAPISAPTFYAQMLTCTAPEMGISRQCGFEDAACDKFLTLAVPEPAESCTWRLQGPPSVWGGECHDSQCRFTYFLPERFRLAVYLPDHDQLFVSNAVSRIALDSTYRLGLTGDGAAQLIETTPVMSRSRMGGALVALLVSLVSELLVGFVYVRLTHAPRRALWGVLIGNVLTVPTIWLLVSSLPTLVLLELGAVIVEGALIAGFARDQMRPVRAYVMSLALNIISLIVGLPMVIVLAIAGFVQLG